MIKFYKNYTHYAEEQNICTKIASRRIRNGTVEVFEVPKGVKYFEIDKEAIVKEYISNLGK